MPSNVKSDFFNLPNTLTMGRIFLIPLVLVLMVQETRPSAFYAALVFSVAAFTDFLDGWLARNFGMQSILGKFMDPVADKIFVMAVAVMLVELGRLPGWLVIILLTREITITALRMVAMSEGLHIDVVQTGKWKTAFQMVGLLGLIVHYTYPTNYLFWETTINYHIVGLMAVGISLFFSIFSAASYFGKFVSAVRDSYTPDGDES
jgi:CDP-diacylglycerol---glycerol-3-phosphate 3-phosphatidyltransferase